MIQCLAEGVTPVMFVDTVTPADVLQEADVAKSGRMYERLEIEKHLKYNKIWQVFMSFMGFLESSIFLPSFLLLSRNSIRVQAVFCYS